MTDDVAIALAPRAHRVLEALHTPVYFAPEAEAEFTGIGLRPGSMPYFAGRAAPMGAVGPGVVAATFYNFNPAMVARHIPRAWTLATPDQVVEARWRVADTVLRRILGDAAGSPEVAELAALAREAVDGLSASGRPLYAGHADLPWPDEPLLQLWHAATLEREYRGDGHVAVLLAAELCGIDALVTHIVTGRSFTVEGARLTRGWSEDDWAEAADRLASRGLLADGALTEAGQALRARIEVETDRLAAEPWRRLGEQRTQRLVDLGKHLGALVVAAKPFPDALFGGRPGPR